MTTLATIAMHMAEDDVDRAAALLVDAKTAAREGRVLKGPVTVRK